VNLVFQIKYRISEEEYEELEKMDKKSWNERGYPDLEGQFCLYFDDETLGFYDEDLPIYNEWIVLSFKHLYKAYNEIINNDYVALKYIGSNVWLEFIKRGCHLKVNLFEEKEDEKFDPGPRDIIVTTPIQNKVGYIWENKITTIKDFKAELDRKAKKLLKEVQEINPAIITEHPFNQLVSYVGN
jgi:hypothetical protein